MVAPRTPLKLIEVEDPNPKGTEVIVRTTHCGLCHSDVHLWEGGYNLGGGKVMSILDRGVNLPLAPSHEIAGVVDAVGPNADGVHVGDKRIVFPWIGCGKCDRCKAGEENLCATMSPIGLLRHGGMAQKVVVPHPRYLVDPGNLELGLGATYACSGITANGAIRKLEIDSPEKPVVLMGAGGLGLSAVALLKAKDHRNTIVVDLNSAKREAAMEAGATAFVDGTASDLGAKIKDAAGGPVPYAIDFVGNDKTARVLFDNLAKGGRVVIVGVAGGELNLSLAGLIFVPRAIMGSVVGTIQDLREVVALANSGKLKPLPIERMPIDQANQALQKLIDGKTTGRIVLEHNNTD